MYHHAARARRRRENGRWLEFLELILSRIEFSALAVGGLARSSGALVCAMGPTRCRGDALSPLGESASRGMTSGAHNQGVTFLTGSEE